MILIETQRHREKLLLCVSVFQLKSWTRINLLDVRLMFSFCGHFSNDFVRNCGRNVNQTLL